MSQLVREHPFELRGGQKLQDPGRRADRCGLRRATNRERVRHRSLGNRHPRLGQVGLYAQALDYRVQLGGLLRAHLLGAHRKQRDLVGGEVLQEEQSAGDYGDHHRTRPGGEQHADQNRVDEAKQEERQQHPGLKPAIATE